MLPRRPTGSAAIDGKLGKSPIWIDNMIRKRLLYISVVIGTALTVTAAIADYTTKDASNIIRTVVSFVCQGSKICPATVLIDSTGTEKGTSANPVVTSGAPYLWTDLGFCSLSSLGSSTLISACSGTYGSGIPSTATTVLFNFEGANIRSTGDGVTTPTSTVGMRHYQGTWWQYDSSQTGLAKIKLIQEASGGIANITFLK